MYKFIKNDAGNITSLKLEDVVFSYSYLVSPRPETDFSPGTYGTELVITDDETVKAIKTYLNEIIAEAKTTTWEGKMPKSLNLPIKKGNDDKEFEAGAYVLKTSSKMQPKLYIREEGEERAHVVEEDELDEIYAGMVGEAIVKFKAYTYNGIKGIKAYLNAVCKTGDGTPFESKIDYEDEFSTETMFDAEPSPKKAKAKPAKKQEVEEEEEELSIDDMLSKEAKPEPKAKSKAPSKTASKAASTDLDIDDLLK
jgi:hypothetical protein